MKEEALQKASQTLESTVQRIDNILLSVEQSTGNVYFRLIYNLDKPDMMYEYSRQLVESNPCVDGCAIAFKKDYYKGHEYFMAYYRRNTHNIPIKESWPDPTLMQPSHQLISLLFYMMKREQDRPIGSCVRWHFLYRSISVKCTTKNIVHLQS